MWKKLKMNKSEEKKILHFLIRNPDKFSFSRIKEIELIKQNKHFRYLDNNEIVNSIISFYFEEHVTNLKVKKNYVKKINGVTAKIKYLLTYQLEKDLVNKDFCKKAFLYLSSQGKFSQILDYFFKMSSEMWYLAGDTSTDINYYSKRLILTSVYSKIFIKLLTFSNYTQDLIEKDVDSSLLSVKKFNDIKNKICSSDILSILKKFQTENKPQGRGF
jgi:ubiquinone biosynthesis protein COQ9